MIRTVFIYFLVSVSATVFAQDSDTWIAFDSIGKDLTYTGFKNNKEVLKIPALFTGRTVARKFDNVIAAMEFVDNRYTDPVYITKTGMVIKDSVYVTDYAFDCENEGHIRYKDPKTGNIGMFNGNAKVVVPAQYNDLGRVYNGLMVGLKGAKKEIDGEYSFWKGGKKQLVDINNKILVDSLNYDGHLNFYSLKVTDTKGTENSRHYFKGVNDKYYSFIDFEEDFKTWVNGFLNKKLTAEDLIANALDTLKYEDYSKEWLAEEKNSFINRNFEHIKYKLLQLTLNKNFTVTTETIVKHIFEPENYSTYYNNCNEIKYWQYPVMSISLQKNSAAATTDRFYFLYTENGYKLIGASLKNSNLN